MQTDERSNNGWLHAALAISLAAAAIGSGLACTGCGRSQGEKQGVAFIHVNVIPMDRPGMLEDQTVLVSGETIERVAPAGTVTVPDGFQRVDGRGRYLLPGLADMHVHLTTARGLLLYLASGVTTVRNMAGRKVHLAWRDSVSDGSLLGPTILTAGPMVDGPKPIWPGSASIETAAQGDSVVREQVAAGYDFIKVYDGLPLDAYRSVLATAHARGCAVAGHLPVAVPLDTALALRQDSIEHLYGYATSVAPADESIAINWKSLSPEAANQARMNLGARLLAGNLSDDDFIDPGRLSEIVRATQTAGTWIVPTLVVFERPVLAGAALVQARAAPEMAYVMPQVLDSWPSPASRPSDLPPEMARYRQSELAVRERIVRALHEAGVGILLGTDAPNPLIVPGFAVHRELRHLVDAGLTPFEAIQTATVNAGRFVGTPATFGSVREGMRADLLLLDANPLDDVANLERRAGVMARGRWLTEAELRSALEVLVTSYGR